jgi:Na+/alanine symporter
MSPAGYPRLAPIEPTEPAPRGLRRRLLALATALSGTVGLGNIAGVGAALAIGGPGATFWMIVVGLLGMASKFTECTLGVKYRTILPSGAVSGGPMYYLRDGLAERGFATLGKVLAVMFSVMVILGALGGGNMFQGNQANAMLVQTFGLPTGYGWVVGLALAAFVFAVIIGGMPSIAAVTSRLVPWMAYLYIGMAVIVIVLNIGSRVVGMVVDAVSDVITLKPDQLRPVPEFNSSIASDHILAIGAVENRMLILVDIEKLMTSSEMGLIESSVQ